MTTTLYRVYDKADRLLYVGIADNPWSRLGSHNGSAWTKHAHKIHLETHETRSAAAEAELAAIRDEDPVWNMQGRDLSRFQKWMMAYPKQHADDITDEQVDEAARGEWVRKQLAHFTAEDRRRAGQALAVITADSRTKPTGT